MRKKTIILAITAFTLGLSLLGKSQTCNFAVDTVKITSAAFVDLQSGIEVTRQTEFVSFPTKNIEWRQKNGAVVYTLFASNESSLILPDEVDETSTVPVSMDDVTGTLTITKTATGLEVTLSLSGGSYPISNRYSSISVQTL